MLETGRQWLVRLLLTALIAVGIVYRGTFASVVQKWSDDAAFSHGFLIVPVCVWLAWRERELLKQVAFRPSGLGVIAVLLCTVAWMVARGSGVLVIEQFAAVALIPAMVLTALGWPATRVLLVPLAFLFFMVPFGRGLVPLLMQVTADFASVLLQWSGVPVLRSYMYINIPGGSFEVARACSGLNYFVTSFVLGCLYAYLNFRSWHKRAVCVAAFLVIPVVLNGLRVYITILVSHLTDMRYGPGVEHVTFGRIFFVLTMLVLFWVGRRWHDHGPIAPTSTTTSAPVGQFAWITLWPLALACLVAASGPRVVASSVAEAKINVHEAGDLVSLPELNGKWQGPDAGAGRWRPQYRGGLVERQAVYRIDNGAPVDVFVAVYGLGSTDGAEMISYRNVVSAEEFGSLAEDSVRVIRLPDAPSLKVRELIVGDDGGKRLVWQWYVVGERPVVGPFGVKALEAFAFLARSANSERIVTVSTNLDDAASERLASFVEANGRCVASGFAADACSE